MQSGEAQKRIWRWPRGLREEKKLQINTNFVKGQIPGTKNAATVSSQEDMSEAGKKKSYAKPGMPASNHPLKWRKDMKESQSHSPFE